MPKIYTDEKRKEVKEKMMKIGLELIKQYGVKKMSVAEITKSVGIAQGTFYNFFSSKEMLIYDLAVLYQEKIDKKVENIIKEKGYLSRKDIHVFYYDMMLKDEDNVYKFIKADDVQNLITRLPKECLVKICDVEATIEKNIKLLKDAKENCDIGSIINWVQIMNLTLQNKNLLIEDSVEKIIDTLIENMLNEIF